MALAKKLSTWTMTGVSIVANADATGKETALSIHAESIVKNGGKPKKGVINLTRAHVRSEGFSLAHNETAKTATIKRYEGSRGRKARTGASAADISAALAKLQA